MCLYVTYSYKLLEDQIWALHTKVYNYTFDIFSLVMVTLM